MKKLLNSVYNCLETQNWYGALLISLTLPDICGFANYPQLHSKERYVKWFNIYLKPKYEHLDILTKDKTIFLTGEDCYALRCSFLHEGSDIIVSQRARKILDNYVFTTTGAHCNYLVFTDRKILQLSVDKFCKDICSGVEKWIENTSNDKEINEIISGMLKIHTSGSVVNGIQYN